jgi:hypothetical protein
MHQSKTLRYTLFTLYSCISTQPIQTGILHFWTDLSDLHIRKDPLITNAQVHINLLHVDKRLTVHARSPHEVPDLVVGHR